MRNDFRKKRTGVKKTKYFIYKNYNYYEKGTRQTQISATVCILKTTRKKKTDTNILRLDIIMYRFLIFS